jgi:Carboxypeptidase regulatory-like domain
MKASGFLAVFFLFELTSATPQIQQASIAGRVTGPSLEPLAGLEVWLFRPEFDLKVRRLLWKPVAVVLTDDRGEYRHVGIEPGRYYLASGSLSPGTVSGTVAVGLRPHSATVTSQKRRYETAFYPGSADVTKATELDIKRGTETTGINFSLKELRTFAIRGRFVDRGSTLTANARFGLTLGLQYRDYTISQTAMDEGSRVIPDAPSNFEITDVPPGHYSVSVTLFIINGPLPPRTPLGPNETREEVTARRKQDEGVLSSGLFQIVSGVATVDIVDRDVDGVIVVCKPATAIEGQVSIEGGERPTFSGLDRMSVSVSPPYDGQTSAAGMPPTPPMEVSPDGTFGFPIFIPWDDYQLEVSGLPDDVYVKAARFGPRDILGVSFPISGPTSDRLEVVLSLKGGRIEGKVVSGDDRPVGNAAAVLVPAAQRQRIDLYRITTTDASGRFTLRGIAPGEYKVIAFENASDSYLAFEPGSLSWPNSGSVSLRVVENGMVTASVRVTP